MTVQELINHLSSFDPESQIMILDSFNGGGSPRDLNHGPRYYFIKEIDGRDCSDCEDRIDEKVVLIGFGCY